MPLPAAALFDFTGTLFHIEPAGSAIAAVLGEQFVPLADEVVRRGGYNGVGVAHDLPADLADAWHERDLSRDAHRRAYSGLAERAGLTAAQAAALYDYSISPQAWSPFADTVSTLRDLAAAGVPTALVSNIGWDPRPVLDRYGVLDAFDSLVLSDERGLLKPDPAIFDLACAELFVQPDACVMVGDNAANDGAAVQLGMRFELVPADPSDRTGSELRAAVGLAA
ncbi:HAD family hydrolase [uncultured Jatrophihabitans sp.]|uniref:HAD family hydrolase n=1 Tax=uncultured Jatrophihabitans sp. TaxID=1610747 RepID=UPI0035CB5B0A